MSTILVGFSRTRRAIIRENLAKFFLEMLLRILKVLEEAEEGKKYTHRLLGAGLG